MENGFAIVLSWPETTCKQAGAWYDRPMKWLGANKNGYYKVGHAAIILIDSATQTPLYYDFGRYHSPKGNGRIRSVITDHELQIGTKAEIDFENNKLLNLDEILQELYQNASTHGTGEIFGAVCKINYRKALNYVTSMSEKGFIPYGPFVRKGSNCSRFVCSVLQSSVLSNRKKLGYLFPLTLTPTPMWNLIATGEKLSSIGEIEEERELIPIQTEPKTAIA